MSDGIRKLYDPHIAEQIAAGANEVRDVPDKIMPVSALEAAVMSDKEIDEMKIDLYIPGYLTGFMLDIDRMNDMYKMPVVRIENCEERLTQFKSILEEECKEIDSIIEQAVANHITDIVIKTQLADLLGDIIVYCASEAKRWGIPIDKVLNIIMQSNFSKLDENGQPIYDDRMKLMKGPAYWRPEPKIAEMLSTGSGGTGVKND